MKAIALLRVARRMEDVAAATAADISEITTNRTAGDMTLTLETHQEPLPTLALTVGLVVALIGLLVLLAVYATTMNSGTSRKKVMPKVRTE